MYLDKSFRKDLEEIIEKNSSTTNTPKKYQINSIHFLYVFSCMNDSEYHGWYDKSISKNTTMSRGTGKIADGGHQYRTTAEHIEHAERGNGALVTAR